MEPFKWPSRARILVLPSLPFPRFNILHWQDASVSSSGATMQLYVRAPSSTVTLRVRATDTISSIIREVQRNDRVGAPPDYLYDVLLFEGRELGSELTGTGTGTGSASVDATGSGGDVTVTLTVADTTLTEECSLDLHRACEWPSQNSRLAASAAAIAVHSRPASARETKLLLQ